MKYFSELTSRTYDTEKECLKAEQEFKRIQEEKKRKEEEERRAKERKNAKRAEDAKTVEAARKDMLEAQKVYKETLEAFVKEYGSYHFSTNSIEDFPHLFMNLFNF